MYYYFSESITIESVNNLIGELKGEDKINLWFSTKGGDPGAMKFLIQFLNTKETIVTLTDRVLSAGTQLFTDFTGELIIDETLHFIMFHLIDRESYSLRKDEWISDKAITKQDLESNKIFAKKLKDKKLLTDKQLKKFMNGRDVVLLQKDFRKWKL